MLKVTETITLWALFMATTVYGHLAFKFAAGNSDRYDYKQAFLAIQSAGVWTGLLAWLASAFLWLLLLTRHGLVEATSISAIRYVFICVATWIFVGGTLTGRDLAGMLLVSSGIYLLAR